MRYLLLLIFIVSLYQLFECKKVSIKLLTENDGNPGQKAVELPSNCGSSSVYNTTNLPRVLNGEVAPKNAWPWSAYVILKYDIADENGLAKATFTACSGSIITRRHVITAAHCFKQKETNIDKFNLQPFAVIGCGDITQGLQSAFFGNKITCGELIRSSQFFIWSKYVPIKSLNDLAIVELERDIEFKNAQQPVCLPTNDKYPVGDAFITGWGQPGLNRPTSPVLLQGLLPIVDKITCQQFSGDAYWNNNALCAGVNDRSSCPGDSGGSLVQQNPTTGRWSLAGVTSGGFCGELINGKNAPSKFTLTNSPEVMYFIKDALSQALEN